MSEIGNICEHGSPERSCRVCELEIEVACQRDQLVSARAERSRIADELGRLRAKGAVPDLDLHSVPVFSGTVERIGTVTSIRRDIAYKVQHYVAFGDYLDAQAIAERAEAAASEDVTTLTRERNEARAEAERWCGWYCGAMGYLEPEALPWEETP